MTRNNIIFNYLVEFNVLILQLLLFSQISTCDTIFIFLEQCHSDHFCAHLQLSQARKMGSLLKVVTILQNICFRNTSIYFHTHWLDFERRVCLYISKTLY